MVWCGVLVCQKELLVTKSSEKDVCADFFPCNTNPTNVAKQHIFPEILVAHAKHLYFVIQFILFLWTYLFVCFFFLLKHNL